MVVVRRYQAARAPRVYHRRQTNLASKMDSREKSTGVRYVALFDCMEAESSGLK